jgi:uncharacterized glyoxalase superfamily protein PhnB
MTDPLFALRQPETPVDPDPTFAARLRARLERALSLPRGVQMTTTVTETRRYSLSPYLAVRNARQALDWYVDVFGARLRGEPYVGTDGRIGHAEIMLGGNLVMLADEHPEIEFAGPETRGGTTVTLHLEVPDVDETLRRAVGAGAVLEREPRDEQYGRTGVIRDPYGHRWMIQTPQAAEPETRPGDIQYVTLRVRDDERARAFFGAVLGLRFRPGRVPRGWQVEGTRPMSGMAGGADEPGAVLMYAVADIDAAVRTVRELGGEATDPQAQPYGRIADCVDDQGFIFGLWQA